MQCDDIERLRLLEGWLPLAQTLNEELGWAAGSAQLEQLIARAAPALEHAANLAEARAILAWYQASAPEDGI